MQLVAAKRSAQRGPEYDKAVKSCSAGIVAEYIAYTCKARQKLLEVRAGSKQWWTLSREFLWQRTKVQTIPALRDEVGSWVHESRSKADLFAKTFNDKNVLPALLMNKYSAVKVNPYVQKKLLSWTEHNVYIILTRLDESSGAGPDLLPARMLR